MTPRFLDRSEKRFFKGYEYYNWFEKCMSPREPFFSKKKIRNRFQKLLKLRLYIVIFRRPRQFKLRKTELALEAFLNIALIIAKNLKIRLILFPQLDFGHQW